MKNASYAGVSQNETRDDMKRRSNLFVKWIIIVVVFLVLLGMTIATFVKSADLSNQIQGLKKDNTAIKNNYGYLYSEVRNIQEDGEENTDKLNAIQRELTDNTNTWNQRISDNKHGIDKLYLKLDHQADLHDYQERHLGHVINFTNHNSQRIKQVEQSIEDIKRKSTTVDTQVPKKTNPATYRPTRNRVVTPKPPLLNHRTNPERSSRTSPERSTGSESPTNGSVGLNNRKLSIVFFGLLLHFATKLCSHIIAW